MKKLLLSFFVIFTFAFYVFFARLQAAPATTIAPVSAKPLGAIPVASPELGLSQTSTKPSPFPTPAPAPTPAPTPTPPSAPKGLYADGDFTGSVADAYYGNVQVKAIIRDGKITDVQFLDHPQDRNTSREINSQAMPYLTQEAIQTQNANVDIISGATETSLAFRESLATALKQEKN